MTEKPSHLDPRIRRTHRYLREAFIQLVIENGFQGVTITDLAGRAFINRSTFYLHYQDKQDLMIRGFQEYWEEALPAQALSLSPDGPEPLDQLQALIRSDLDHIDQLRPFYRVMLCEGENPSFRDSFYQHLLTVTQARLAHLQVGISLPLVPSQLFNTWIASAYLGVIKTWLSQDHPSGSAELASQIGKLFRLPGQHLQAADHSVDWQWAVEKQMV